ncbi:MAG: holo-ACP synthase [Bacteroidota bacterium]|nr:holo-ACP synthase [Bacteroidota bacterium]
MNGIVGIGVDIEEIARFEGLLGQWGRRFEHRIFSEPEIRYCNAKIRPAQHFAARFAAKEAFSKAIGTGWTGAFRWTDVEVRNDEAGKPAFVLHNGLARQCSRWNIHLSLSHSGAYVAAMVVIQDTDT